MKGRLAIIFQGNIRTDARVLRETLSLSENWNVDVYASNLEDTDRNLVPKNVRLYGFEMDSRWIYRNLFFGKQFKALLNQIDAFSYDVILCIDYPTLEVAIELKKKNPQLKIWYDSHEIYIETINQFFPKSGWKHLYGKPLIFFNQRYHYRREQKLVKQTDGILTVCQSLRDYFEPRWNRKVEVLRNCPMKEHFEVNRENVITRETLGLKESDFVLIYQGDINPGRGLHFLLEVMKQLPDNYQLLIVGDGMLRQELEQSSSDRKNVHFTGRVPYMQLQYYTRLADVGVNLIEPINASKRLSLPNKLFEYMACGVPFVSNNLPEPRMLVEEYGTGILVEMDEAREVANAFIQLNENKAKRLQMSEKGKSSFHEKLNWKVEFINFVNRFTV